MHLLYHLVCESKAVTPLTTAQLTAALEDLRTYYGNHAVTGLLLYRPDGQIMQVLEGDEHVLRSMLRDDTSTFLGLPNCAVLEEGPWARRSFPDWSMSFLPDPGDTPPATDGFVPLRSLRTLLPQLAPTRPTLVHRLLEFVAPYDEAAEP